MKTTQILRQDYEVSNDFNSDLCIKALKAQIQSSCFKELINGEKHSLKVSFIIYVNEEEAHELDQEKLKALKICKRLQEIDKEKAENPSKFDLLSLWFAALKIDTSLLKKHDIETSS